jgi:NCAIR mutase (PurE)-related protein
MDRVALRALLQELESGAVTAEAVMTALQDFPSGRLGYAHVDHHRHLRRGFPEVVLAEGKETEHLIGIVMELSAQTPNILVTRVSEAQVLALEDALPPNQVKRHPPSSLLTIRPEPAALRGDGCILVVSAGTSDLRVAEEAAVTAETMGHHVERLVDVGVAGIHRLLGHVDTLRAASVVVVAAGMDGALPSVVAGLVDCPVVAVPTSVGYGSSFEGLAALLTMLNSCAAGVTVVNIDNGVGAGYAASLMIRDGREEIS